MSDSKEVKVTKENYYSIDNSSVPKYEMIKMSPTKNQGVDTVGVTSQVEYGFELAAGQYNLSQFMISYDVKYPAGAASNYTVVVKDTPPLLRGITLRGKNYTTDIFAMDQLNRYLRAVLPRRLGRNEYLSRDENQSYAPSNKFVGNVYAGLPNIVNSVATAAGTDSSIASSSTGAHGVNIATYANGTTLMSLSATTGAIVQVAGAIEYLGGNITPLGYPAAVNMLENQHIVVDTTSAHAYATTNNVFKLSDIKDSIFSIDKDTVWPDNMVLNVRLGYANEHAFYTTDASCANGTPFLDRAGAINTAMTTGNCTITNVTLYIAKESNPDLLLAGQNMLAQGYSLVVPFHDHYANPVASGNTNQRMNWTIANPGSGAMLKRIYWTAFENSNGNAAWLCLQNSNSSKFAATPKIASYYTQLDSKRLYPDNIDCTRDEDYYHNLKTFTGSSISISKEWYKYCWSHCDDFTEGKEDDNAMLGIEMKGNMNKYDIFATMHNSTQVVEHHVWAVINRLLRISPQGINFA